MELPIYADAIDSAPPEEETRNALEALFVEIFLLLLGLMVYLVFVLPAAMRFTAAKHPTVPPDFLTVSVLPGSDGKLPPILVGDDVGIHVEDSDGNRAFSDDPYYNPADAPYVRFAGNALTNYPLRCRGKAESMQLSLWLRTLDSNLAGNNQYQHGLLHGFRLAVYSARDALTVQQAIESNTLGAGRPGVLVLELRPDNGYRDSVSLEDLLSNSH